MYVCHSEIQCARVPLNGDMVVVDAKRIGLCEELQRCWVLKLNSRKVCLMFGILTVYWFMSCGFEKMTSSMGK